MIALQHSIEQAKQGHIYSYSSMASSYSSLFLFMSILATLLLPSPLLAANSKLFREYIGAIEFSDVPINPSVNFHFILAFAIDYTTSSPHNPTNGHFNIFWNNSFLCPAKVASIKRSHGNVKVALSLGGDSIGGSSTYFTASSADSWVNNSVSSLTAIIKQYNLDGIDIDYEHFNATPNIFTECIGQVLTKLKKNGVIKFASIAPFDNNQVQSYYLQLWKKYGDLIDYVNFQFYAYDKSTNVSQFLSYFEKQSSNYNGGKVLVSFASVGSGGLTADKGFFTACDTLKKQGKLHGIFVWYADDSKKNGFLYEKQAQRLLASA